MYGRNTNLFIATQYTLGLFLLVLVALIWVASSFVVQAVQEFTSPFLITYVANSLFVILLPAGMIQRWWKRSSFRRALLAMRSRVSLGAGVDSSENDHVEVRGDDGDRSGETPLNVHLEPGTIVEVSKRLFLHSSPFARVGWDVRHEYIYAMYVYMYGGNREFVQGCLGSAAVIVALMRACWVLCWYEHMYGGIESLCNVTWAVRV
jgi:hypothetical protein